MPLDLISLIVEFRVIENREKAKAKKEIGHFGITERRKSKENIDKSSAKWMKHVFLLFSIFWISKNKRDVNC